MSLGQSCSSCTCNVWGMQSPSVSSCGRGGCRSMVVTPICYCGEKSVLKMARTTKNKGKIFWDCPKCKVKYMETLFWLGVSVFVFENSLHCWSRD